MDNNVAVARLTAQMLDPWERVRCLPRCRSDEPMNHGECDCGSQQFVSDLRTLLAAYADAARDRERMDWLDRTLGGDISEIDVEREPGGRVSVAAYTLGLMECRVFAQGQTLRAAIDAARTGEAR